MIRVCLTHDVDRTEKTYQYITKPIIKFLKGDLFSLFKNISLKKRNRPYWGFDYITEIESKYSVKSTFFILNETIRFNPFLFKTWKLALGRYNINDKKIVSIIRELDSNGWEIGLHGSYLSYKNLELLKKEKAALESILGHSISGIRQHYLNLCTETWSNQETAGFLYDSSWGMINKIGFKDDKILPFFPLKKKQFCVIPLNIMDYPFVNISNKWERFEEIIHTIEINNGFLVINFHSNNFDEFDFPDYRHTYEIIIQKLYRKNAQFITMSEANTIVRQFSTNNLSHE